MLVHSVQACNHMLVLGCVLDNEIVDGYGALGFDNGDHHHPFKDLDDGEEVDLKGSREREQADEQPLPVNAILVFVA